ncbi:MAG: hypothetical protein LW711_17350 [Saprospiraceae bacterium]|jgi:hypothetical protein|nr:hypothetical protein [Saprospiraceae bacterium]
MSTLHFNDQIGFPGYVFQVGLSLIEFNENDVNIVYSPALDISGYGYNSDEAKNSFNIALHEFFQYTNNKKTFDKVLRELGWTIKGSKKKPKMEAPLNSDLIAKNPLYNDIINSKNYKVYKEDVEFVF